MTSTPTYADILLARTLARDTIDLHSVPEYILIDRARFHGVCALILDVLPQIPSTTGLRDSLKTHVRNDMIWEIRHRQILEELCQAFSSAMIDYALMKGSAVGYFAYKNPAARSRSDTDLLVSLENLPRARQILRDAGFLCNSELPERKGGLQQCFMMKHSDGTVHAIDLHWSAINSQFLSHLLPTSYCLDTTMPLSSLCDGARMLSPAMLLLHSAVHRLMHRTAPFLLNGHEFRNPNRLIWAVDTHVLTDRFSDHDWQALLNIVEDRKIQRVLSDHFEFAEQIGKLNVPDDVRRQLTTPSARSIKEEKFLLHHGRWRRAMQNFLAIPTPQAKYHFIIDRIAGPRRRQF